MILTLIKKSCEGSAVAAAGRGCRTCPTVGTRVSGQAMPPNAASLLLDPDRAGFGRRVLFTKSLVDVAIENRGKRDPESHCSCPKMGSGCSDRLCHLPGCPAPVRGDTRCKETLSAVCEGRSSLRAVALLSAGAEPRSPTCPARTVCQGRGNRTRQRA